MQRNRSREDTAMEEARVAELKESWSLFSRYLLNYDGTMDRHHLGDLMRSIGQNPTAAELQDLQYELECDGNDHFSFPNFLELIAHRCTLGACDTVAYFFQKAMIESLDAHARWPDFVTAALLALASGDIFTEAEKQDLLDEVERLALDPSTRFSVVGFHGEVRTSGLVMPMFWPEAEAFLRVRTMEGFYTLLLVGVRTRRKHHPEAAYEIIKWDPMARLLTMPRVVRGIRQFIPRVAKRDLLALVLVDRDEWSQIFLSCVMAK